MPCLVPLMLFAPCFLSLWGRFYLCCRELPICWPESFKASLEKSCRRKAAKRCSGKKWYSLCCGWTLPSEACQKIWKLLHAIFSLNRCLSIDFKEGNIVLFWKVASFLSLAYRTIKTGPSTNYLFLYDGGANATFFTILAVDFKIHLEVAAFLAGVDKITDG